MGNGGGPANGNGHGHPGRIPEKLIPFDDDAVLKDF
jgi:hypothetical protein